MSGERHRDVLNDWANYEGIVSQRVSGNWLLRCGHCGVSLGGLRGLNGPTTEVVWQRSPGTWFGSFTVAG